MSTGTESYTTYWENGFQVFPCRCGEQHAGDYGMYDHAHHNCFHDVALVDIGSPEIDGYLVCPLCGKTFNVAGSEDA